MVRRQPDTTCKVDNTKRRAMAIVMAAFNHTVKEEEGLDSNPISGLRKPAGFARRRLIYCSR